MGRMWGLESGGVVGGKAMEDMLIEVFGCVSLNSRVIRLEPGRDKLWFRTDAAVSEHVMEDMLIEVFGCVSLNNRVIRLESGRDKLRRPSGLRADAVACTA